MLDQHSSIEKKLIGRAERISFSNLKLFDVPARVDTGARNSAIWVSEASVVDGELQVVFFDKRSQFYTGEKVIFKKYGRIAVASSNGHIDKRFSVMLQVIVLDKKIRATFTLANRNTQVYPVLLGRNILRGKFIVDVQKGRPLLSEEKRRILELRKKIEEERA